MRIRSKSVIFFFFTKLSFRKKIIICTFVYSSFNDAKLMGMVSN